MKYSIYFKPQQKVLLRTQPAGREAPHFEAITAYVTRVDKELFDLTVPYDLDAGEESPFRPGMTFALISEAFGLGVNVTGDLVENVDRNVIRIRIHENLEAFSRREYPRVEATAGVHCVRGKWSLPSCRKRWEEAVRAIGRDSGASARRHLVRQPVNLSAGGIRLLLKGPVALAELCLVLIDPGDEKPAICALCEVVWTGKPDEMGMQQAGLRFINILQADRQRLDTFVRDELRQHGSDIGDSGARQELLDRMLY